MPEQTLIFVKGMVVDRDGFFQVRKTHWELYRGENMVTTWSGAQDGSTSNVLLTVIDGKNLVIHNRNRRTRDTVIGAPVHRRKALARTCSGIYLKFEHVIMPFVRHSDEAENVR